MSTDASQAGVVTPDGMRRSQLANILRMNQAPIIWRSTTRTVTARIIESVPVESAPLSVGESETYALSNGIQDNLHFSYVCEEMGMNDFPSPMTVFTDSTVAIAFSQGTCKRSKLKHIDVRQQWVRIMRDYKKVVVKHISGKLNVSDLLTKVHAKHEFVRLRLAVGGRVGPATSSVEPIYRKLQFPTSIGKSALAHSKPQ